MTPLANYLWIPRGAPSSIEEPPPPPVDQGVFTLEGRSNYSLSTPVMNNGVTLTGDAKDIFDGMVWLLDDYYNRVYVVTGNTMLESATQDNLYNYARNIGTLFNELFVGLKITGYLGFLDAAVKIADDMYSVLDKGYRWNYIYRTDNAPDFKKGLESPQHWYDMWIWKQSDLDYQGTDNHPLDNLRTHAPLAQLGYALELNRGKISPAGYNYGAKADMWRTYFTDTWMKIWVGPEEALGRDKAGNPASGWASNWKGNLHQIAKLPGSGESSQRAPTGWWPIHSRHHTHTNAGAGALHYWLGQFIPEFNIPSGAGLSEGRTASGMGLVGIKDWYIARNVYYYRPSGASYSNADYAVWPRSLHWTGHGTESDPNGNYPQPMTYAGYIVMDLVNLWLSGVLPEFPEMWAKPVVRTLNEYAWTSGLHDSEGNTNLNSGDASAADLLGGRSLTGSNRPTNVLGQQLTFRSASEFNFSNDQSNGTIISRAYGLLLPWDTSDNKMTNHLTSKMNTSSHYRGTNITDQPKNMNIPLGRLMSELGAGSWEIG